MTSFFLCAADSEGLNGKKMWFLGWIYHSAGEEAQVDLEEDISARDVVLGKERGQGVFQTKVSIRCSTSARTCCQ